ncbi:hypothetical protein ACNKU7_08190 [Microbulbifer sp. SA54]|uniref:hypothetical protein n=1 Tax=Microbulbifer sp. SA54 TaxID=3401577 RepID=UPI003AB040B0
MNRELREQLKHNFRKEVFEVLELISSREEQLDYQEKVPIAYVSAELFNQWEDCFQIPKGQEWYAEAFNQAELRILELFDGVMEIVAQNTPENPPDIHEFVESKEWAQLASAASRALGELKKI